MRLWIAFKIVFFAVVDSFDDLSCQVPLVVNCFQNCIFRCRWQHMKAHYVIWASCELLSKLYFSLSLTAFLFADRWQIRCELLSKLYFSLSLTANLRNNNVNYLLWIAFKIVFFAVVDSFYTYALLVRRLWIAFKIVFFAVVDSNKTIIKIQGRVVNCFQNCIFRCRWQQ